MKIDELKLQACGKWQQILSSVAGIPIECLDKKHHKCPSGKCDSQRDAFRFTDLNSDGSALCNKCGKWGDGFAVIQHFLGCDFQESMKLVADHIGHKPPKKTNPIDSIHPLSKSALRDFAEKLATAKGIDVSQILRSRCFAISKFNQQCLAFQTYDPTNWKPHSMILYRADGELFPAFGDKLGERKHHIVAGSGKNKDGLFIVGTVDEFKAATTCWICEGITDAITAAGLFATIPRLTVCSNICGAGSFPESWKKAFSHFERVVVCGDNDDAGLIGMNKRREALA